MELTKGYFLAAAAGVSWATTGIFSTLLFQEGLHPLEIASARIFLAAIMFFFYCLTMYRSVFRLKVRELFYFAVSGLIGVGFFNFFYLQAIERIGVSVAVVLLYISPVFVLTVSFFLLQERISFLKVIASTIAIAGVFLTVRGYELLYFPGALDYGGIALGVGAGLSFASLSVFGKYALGKYELLKVVFYMMFFGALSFSFYFPPWTIFQREITTLALLLLLAIALISTFLAHFLYILGLQYVEAGKASVAVAVEPPAAIFLAFVILGENLNFWQYIGVVLVLAAVVLLRRDHK